MNWNRLHYKNEASHVVADGLVLAIREDMARAIPPGVPEGTIRVDKICLERGGPCYTDRPYEEVLYCGLAIRIPSEDLGPLLLQWEGAARVTSRGQDFYRLASWPDQCLVLAPKQRVDLLDLLVTRVDQAQMRTAVFQTNRRSPQEVMSAYHEGRGAGISYGPDGVTKFRS